MDRRARRCIGSLTAFAVTLALLSALVTSCTEPIQFHAAVDPSQGHVPYAARIVCTRLAGTYTYRLPGGETVTSDENELEVTVDRLEWEATVTWANGEQVRTETVSAQGTNAPPTILAPRINGDPSRWFLRPRERTLIDFTHYPTSLSGPESGVVYDGEWQVADIQVECKLKRLCGSAVGDSIFRPPYEEGVYHAVFRGQTVENACIVYPLYSAETASNGRPYAPAPEDGYIYDAARVRDIFQQVEFPAQSAKIQVVVEDDWGRLTSGSFEISVEAGVYGGGSGSATDYRKAVFYVASRTSPLYHRSTCDAVCQIPKQDRLYFCGQENAEASGKKPAPDCFGVK